MNQQSKQVDGDQLQLQSPADKPKGIAARIKIGIVALALLGVLSPILAAWLIQKGGLKNV